MLFENHLWKLENFGLFHLSILYICFIRVFIPVDFIYNFFVYNELIDMILKEIFCYTLALLHFSSLNILFVSASCLHKYRILLIAKNTSLLKAFTSKNGMLSDVIVTVYLNKWILLSRCELSIGLARRK